MTLKRFGWISLLTTYYFILFNIFIGGLAWLWLFFSDLSNGMDISTGYSFILSMTTSGLAFIFVPAYAVFYKLSWIKKPAKIIFLTFFIGFLLSSDDLIEFSGASFILMLPLLHLYKDNIKAWVASLKSKPFFSFKKMPEISRQDMILGISAIIIIIIANLSYPWEYWRIIPEIILMLIFLLSKQSILRDIAKIVIFIVSILLLCEVVYSPWLDSVSFHQGIITANYFF